MSIVDDIFDQIRDLYFNESDLTEVDLILIQQICASQTLSSELARKLLALNDDALRIEVLDTLSRLAGLLFDDADVYETYIKITLPSMSGVGGSLLAGGAIYGAIKATSIAGVVTVGAPLVFGGIAIFFVGGFALNRWSSIKRAKLKSEREIRELIKRIE